MYCSCSFNLTNGKTSQIDSRFQFFFLAWVSYSRCNLKEMKHTSLVQPSHDAVDDIYFPLRSLPALFNYR
jgi:hypothetical protein